MAETDAELEAPSSGEGLAAADPPGDRWNRIRYRLYAPVYDVITRPMERGRERAIELADPQPGDRILILGCGTGLDLASLPEDVSVTAIDAVPGMVERTEARAESLDIDADARVGDAQSPDVADGAFDVVFLHLVLTVVPDPAAVIEETERALAPNGRVTVFDKFVPDGRSPSLVRRMLNPVARFLFSDVTRSLEPMLAGTDLSVEERERLLGNVYTVATVGPDGDETA